MRLSKVINTANIIVIIIMKKLPHIPQIKALNKLIIEVFVFDPKIFVRKMIGKS